MANERKLYLMCVNCGKKISQEETRGCLTQPYCKKCFEKVWNNDEEAYLRTL
ncbi:hypothetical protein LCGC14_0405900 [marine sediment metagenome]|uniref:Uncharacterized protein n=1 Tax=marine sediment metagenome TaxID=412755 RepID=A0A0F9VHA6_9ZZZZ